MPEARVLARVNQSSNIMLTILVIGTVFCFFFFFTAVNVHIYRYIKEENKESNKRKIIENILFYRVKWQLLSYNFIYKKVQFTAH